MCAYCEAVSDEIHELIRIQKVPGRDDLQVQFLVSVDYQTNIGSITWNANGRSESFIFTAPESSMVMNVGFEVKVAPLTLIELDSSGDLFAEAVNELVHTLLKAACERGEWTPYFEGKIPFPTEAAPINKGALH